MKKKSDREFVDLFSITDLAKADKISRPTVMKRKNYIKFRFKTSSSVAQYKAGNKKTPYAYKYARWEDIRYIIEKQFGMTLAFTGLKMKNGRKKKVKSIRPRGDTTS